MRAKPLPSVDLWLASSRDAADQVFEALAERHPGAARPVLSLPIPQSIAASPSYLADQIVRFREQADPVLSGFMTQLERIRGADYPQSVEAGDLLPDDNRLSEAWEAVVDQHFPASTHGRSAMVFYLLPEHGVPSLLRIEPTADADHERRHGLLAVLHP